MTLKIHGIRPETGSWTEGKLIYASKDSAGMGPVITAEQTAAGIVQADLDLEALVKEAESFGTIVILELASTVAHFAFGYAANSNADLDPTQDGLTDHGYTVGAFTVV